MIVVKLKGGLGNQMFEYAVGRALSLRYNTVLKLDVSFFDLQFPSITKRSYNLDIFNISAKVIRTNKIFIYLASLFGKITKNKGQEKSFEFDPEVFSWGPHVSLGGYFQSPKYFAGYEDIIRKDFTLKNSLPDRSQNLLNEIKNQNSVCMHVRRGDYVGNKDHDVVTKEYYDQGLEYIRTKTNIDTIYVFSDDIEWCKNNLTFPFPTVFVGEEYAGEKAEGHLILMSAGKHFIIPNSSFSWWAAWLNPSKEKIVIAPKKWFADESINTSDLIPETWIRI